MTLGVYQKKIIRKLVNMESIKCKYSEDGYCIRPENNYCHSTECKGCEHKDTSIVVIEATLTSETTAIQCDYCGKILTKPKTECN